MIFGRMRVVNGKTLHLVIFDMVHAVCLFFRRFRTETRSLPGCWRTLWGATVKRSWWLPCPELSSTREKRFQPSRFAVAFFFFFFLVFSVLRPVGENEGHAPTLPRIRYMSCASLIRCSRCHRSSRCFYRAREHIDPT